MFRDKVIYITGASSGLGRELAIQLAREGAHLALFARRLGHLEELLKQISQYGVRSHIAILDVTNREAVLEAFESAKASIGPCDILIANAGVGFPVKVTAWDAAKVAQIYAVNVMGALHCIEAVLPSMIPTKIWVHRRHCKSGSLPLIS
jgi:NADP-dependent 3-hydroxy acid dehydrogenase YdfG